VTRTQGEAPRTDDLAEPGDPAGDAVPRLPRGRGIRLSRPELVRVAGLAILLGFLLVTQRPCASAVSKFVTSFGDQGSAAAAMPRPGTIDPMGKAPRPAGRAVGGPTGGDEPGLDGYEHLRPGMTDAEIKAVIDHARARARTGSASGGPR
jgi:hypothetical protein